MPLDIVILAAGQGTRMNSALPKVLHTLAGKPMLQHVIDAAKHFDAANIHVVIGHGAEQIRTTIADDSLNWVLQNEQRGTGHALTVALPMLDAGSTVLVLYGDVPLVSPATLRQLVFLASDNSVALLTADLPDPNGYGRIVRDAPSDAILRIVEQKDASENELNIKEVNTGILAVSTDQLKQWLPQLTSENAQQEYYLTDIIALAVKNGVVINSIRATSEAEIQGVNDRYQLSRLETVLREKMARHLMASGITIIDPARFDCRGTINAGKDITLDINVVFEGEVELGDNVSIGPNCTIINSRIASNTCVHANSVIEGAVIGENCVVGPFARLRPGTILQNEARVGNFVELKNTMLGKHSKANHLAYLGDSKVGDNSNIGAGTITCNYDGVNKHQTIIGHNAFIGSNTSLVAPVTIGDHATVGAGSTVTKSVGDSELAVARGQQRNIQNWNRPQKTSKPNDRKA